jgi:hypothetical protein
LKLYEILIKKYYIREVYGMSSVNHKSWGLGTVVKREVLNNGKYTEVEYGGNYITARFDNGKEVRFAIPSSFYTGKLEPMADFADEVADVTEELESKRQAGIPTWGISDGKRDIDESEERTKKIPAKINVTGNMKEDFKTYLTESGYEPSVVYAYPRAIGIVCAEENIGWKTLLLCINKIIPLYSKDGVKEHIGNYQNKTVINALKRYRDFALINSDALL